MLVKNTIISRIIIGLFLIMLTCWLPALGAVNATKSFEANMTADSSVAPTVYFINIDPIGNHTVGDVFYINGTTNLPVTKNLTMEIIDAFWFARSHLRGEPDHPRVGLYTSIPYISIARNSDGSNRWAINVTNAVKELEPSYYVVAVWSETNASCPELGCPGDPSLAGTTSRLFLTALNSTEKPNIVTLQSFQTSVTSRPYSPNNGSLSPTSQSSHLSPILTIGILIAMIVFGLIHVKERD